MACHEIAALRLGMLNVLGVDRPTDRQHELAELGDALTTSASLKNLAESSSFEDLRRGFEDSLSQLEDRVSGMPATDAQRPYYQSLLVLNKKIEMDLRQMSKQIEQYYLNLEEIHDQMHEVFPDNDD
jgi:hypothetical protein